MKVTIPWQYEPRDYQLNFLRSMDSGIKRACWVVHRRAGKDKTAWNLIIKKAIERVGNYYYLLPTYSQAKKVIWEGKDREGFAFLDHIPKEIIDGEPNSSELKVKLKNGSMIQLIGVDNKDSLMGTNPVGCVFSEYSLMDPDAWEFMRPILAENGGFAVFLFTPRGKNHGFELYENAKDNPAWFCELLTVEDTKALSLDMVEEERAAGMSEDLIQQEFFCSFTSGIEGSYYSQQIKQAEDEGRVTTIPYSAGIPVETYWDLGIADHMAVWFVQQVGLETRFIDCLDATGWSVEDFVQEFHKRGYTYGTHYWPHDGEVRELSSGKSRKEIAEKLGLRPIRIVPNIPIQDGINALRMNLNRCWFEKDKCKRGLDALRNYCKDWDEKRKEFKPHPRHSWESHFSDAARYWAVSFRERRLQSNREPIRRKKATTGMRMA